MKDIAAFLRRADALRRADSFDFSKPEHSIKSLGTRGLYNATNLVGLASGAGKLAGFAIGSVASLALSPLSMLTGMGKALQGKKISKHAGPFERLGEGLVGLTKGLGKGMIDKGLDENASAAEEFGAFIGQFGSGLSKIGRGFKAGLKGDFGEGRRAMSDSSSMRSMLKSKTLLGVGLNYLGVVPGIIPNKKLPFLLE